MNVSEAAARVMVALDKPDAAEALRVAEALRPFGCWVKVGLELFYAVGPDIVRECRRLGFRIFLDLKLHDIPNQVKGAARSLARLGVDMINVHAAGGTEMMRAAAQGAAEGAEAAGRSAPPLIVAVTQLTSTTREMMNGEIGIPGEVEDTVLRYARLAKKAGLHGVVASPLEATAVKRACGRDFLAVTPGIRPAGHEAGDQRRIASPLEALRAGADFLVVGRPVAAAPDPAAALEQILKEMTEA